MPRRKPEAEIEVSGEPTKPPEEPQESDAVEGPETVVDDLEKFIREIVTEATQPYVDRLTDLEVQVQDLNNLVGAPEGSVQFFSPEPQVNRTPPQPLEGLSRDDDVPEYSPAHREDNDGVPWLGQ